MQQHKVLLLAFTCSALFSLTLAWPSTDIQEELRKLIQGVQHESMEKNTVEAETLDQKIERALVSVAQSQADSDGLFQCTLNIDRLKEVLINTTTKEIRTALRNQPCMLQHNIIILVPTNSYVPHYMRYNISLSIQT